MEHLINALVQASGTAAPSLASILSPTPAAIDTMRLAGSSSVRSTIDRPIRPLPSRIEEAPLRVNIQTALAQPATSVSPTDIVSSRRRELGQENDHERFQVFILQPACCRVSLTARREWIRPLDLSLILVRPLYGLIRPLKNPANVLQPSPKSVRSSPVNGSIGHATSPQLLASVGSSTIPH